MYKVTLILGSYDCIPLEVIGFIEKEYLSIGFSAVATDETEAGETLYSIFTSEVVGDGTRKAIELPDVPASDFDWTGAKNNW